MALPRLALAGNDFTVTKWNSLIDALESLGSSVIGHGVVNGLALSVSSGLDLAISNGLLNFYNPISLSSIPDHTCTDNSTFYLWVNEDGTFDETATTTSPGGTYICLGKITTLAGAITAILDDNRQWIESLQSVTQPGGMGYVTVAAANITLTHTQHKNRVIEFTGVLTASIDVVFPKLAGCQWTLIDSSTGIFTITAKCLGGTGVALAHTKTCVVHSNGTDIARDTVNCP